MLLKLSLVVLAGLGTTAADEGKQTQPFRGKPHPIPGVIEAEEYDKGEPGHAYHDTDQVNHGADFRGVTQVDIEKRPDASQGYGIGWTRKGEWLIYTVHVQKPGDYTIEIPVASNKKGGIFHLEFDGKDVTGPIQVPDTGGWDKLKTITVKGVTLPKGTFSMKVMMDSVGPSGSIADIDYFRFIPKQ